MTSKQPAGQIDFAEGSVRRKTLALAAPMLVAQMLNLLYNIVDRIYIGKIPGEGTAALAGLGLCFPVVTLVTAFTNLFGAGGAQVGERRNERSPTCSAQAAHRCARLHADAAAARPRRTSCATHISCCSCAAWL